VTLESDTGDEIDWEWLGGTDKRNEVQTNYFGQRKTGNWDRGGLHPVQDIVRITRNYTITWSPYAISWYIDNHWVRTVTAQAAANSGNWFPQTPCRVKIGTWAGGDKDNANGTITWAGGLTNYSQGPFSMYVEQVKVWNMNPATLYEYKDRSGTWQSIYKNNAGASGPPPLGAGTPSDKQGVGVGAVGVKKGDGEGDGEGKGGFTKSVGPSAPSLEEGGEEVDGDGGEEKDVVVVVVEGKDDVVATEGKDGVVEGKNDVEKGGDDDQEVVVVEDGASDDGKKGEEEITDMGRAPGAHDLPALVNGSVSTVSGTAPYSTGGQTNVASAALPSNIGPGCGIFGGVMLVAACFVYGMVV